MVINNDNNHITNKKIKHKKTKNITIIDNSNKQISINSYINIINNNNKYSHGNTDRSFFSFFKKLKFG